MCRRTAARIVLLLVVMLPMGCATRLRPPVRDRPFAFDADTFAFANETVWEYHFDRATGASWWYERDPPPPYSLRCGPMVRAARQFFASARFDPGAPPVDDDTYTRLVRDVMATDRRGPAARPVVIPGYADLRSFSAAHGALLQANMSGVWTSQLQRGNWRMIFPFSAGHQAATADRLRAELARGWPAIVHVLRYPRLTLNHMVLVYAVEETPAELRFVAYDPNEAAEPIVLAYDRVTRRFSYPETPYFPGGPVRAYEIYDGLLY
ncbi:MAG: hypothetical protein ACREQL_08230 [Candidatus Binatia bacterium]